MDMKVYVINFKETEISSSDTMDVESGVCDYGYLNEDEALKFLNEMFENKKNELIDTNFTVDEGEDYKTIICEGNTYEYWISNVMIIGGKV